MASPTVDSVLANLTLQEKISLLAGGDVWSTVPIAAKGVPSVKVSDGPNGARGVNINGISAACFPAACSVAATFDVDVAHRIGAALGEETLTKGAKCLLAPTVCIHRHPLGGRNFESFSEDPFLTGHLASATVTGLQSQGVSATVKHYAVNEQETRRLDVNAIVSQRALREIYLKPFEMIVKKSAPWAIMTSYNKINGEHADSHDFLLEQVLRREWGWKGLVMSDWGGTNSTAGAINAGMALEMPGTAIWMENDKVMAAINDGTVTNATIDARAREVLEFVDRVQGLSYEEYEEPQEHAVNDPKHAALIREAGGKGIVLLKNQNNCLPLTKDKLRGRKVAMLGYARDCLAHGGGSASVLPHYRVTPWDAFSQYFMDSDVETKYAKGAHTFRQLPVLADNVVDRTGKPGFTYYVYEPSTSTPIKTEHGYDKSEISLANGHPLKDVDVELVGVFRPPETADFYLSLLSLGPCEVSINKTVVLSQKENCRDAMAFLFGGVPIPSTKVFMEEGKEYEIRIFATQPLPSEDPGLGFLKGHVGIRLGCMSATVHDEDILTAATELARKSDYAIVFTGHDPAWETEGQDRPSFSLPKDGSQDRLVESVTAVCPNVIVVNSTGSAVAMPWLESVDALLQSWFPGQEAGNSIVDVLTGEQNPEGHLPCTFPKKIESSSAFPNFPGEIDHPDGPQVRYDEGVFVGYRHYDRLPREDVHFPFGFGLSYTAFSFGELTVSEVSANTYRVAISVSNLGAVKGSIAVQVYVGESTPNSENPVKVLAGLSKVAVDVGQTSVVKIEVNQRDFATWNEEQYAWVIEAGSYDIGVYRSSQDLVDKKAVEISRKIFGP